MERIIFIGNLPYLEKLGLQKNNEFSIEGFDNSQIFDENNIRRVDIKAIVICELYSKTTTTTLLENIFLLRYFGYDQPVIVLSFLFFRQLCQIQPDILADFKEDPSHQFLRLPVTKEELLETIKKGSKCAYPKELPFVKSRAGKEMIDHVLGRSGKNNLKESSIIDYPNTFVDVDFPRYGNLPVCNVLLLDDDPEVLAEAEFYLKLYKKKHPDLDFILNLIKTQESSQVKELILNREKNIQCILLDWMLKSGDGEQRLRRKELVSLIQGERPELPIHIFSQSVDGISILKDLNNTNNIGFFTKEQIRVDPNSIFDKIVHQFNKRRESRFWEAYKQYVDKSTDTWHTPGHSRGASFRKSPFLLPFYNYFGENMFAADLSVSVEELGSLLDSTAYIKEAQDKAARTFGSKRVFFATNGSSTSNKIIIQTMLRPGDGVIVDRNCHKSVHYGIIQAGAMPYYMNSEFDIRLKIFSPPAIDEIKQRIKTAGEEADKEGIKLKAIIITGCTYDGMLIDVKQVVQIAHSAGLKIFIDEAWFAYSGFHPKFRQYSAIHSGADYVTHSAHKVLSAFSQASYIHINDPDFDEDYFREMFYIYTSTSPQYNIIASLDVAATQMEMEGFSLLDKLLEDVEYFRKGIKTFKRIKLVENKDFQHVFKNLVKDKVGFDPFKVLIDISELEYDEKELHKFLLSEGGLEIEKTTVTTVLVLFTIGTTTDKIFRLFAALKVLDDGNVYLKKQSKTYSKSDENKKIDLSFKLAGLPSLAFFSKDRKLMKLSEINDSTDKYVSVNLVTPYPPGIPYLVPNQIITSDIVKELILLNQNGIKIHGCHEGMLWVAEKDDINKNKF